MPEPGPPEAESFDSWMDRIRQGDEAAARWFVATFSGRLLGLAERRLDRGVRRRTEPEDVLQSVFRTFFRRLAAGSVSPVDPARLWALLARITARKCIDTANHHRRLRRDPSRERSIDSEGEGGSVGPVDLPPDAVVIARDALEHAQRGLDERGRAIVSLVLIGEAPESIAEQVGCSRSTVFRVLGLLRRRLEEVLNDEP